MKKFVIIIALSIIAILSASANTTAYACDASDDTCDIGSAIWMDETGMYHTSDGHSWYENEGFCYDHQVDLAVCTGQVSADENGETAEELKDLGPAIWMDATGLTQTNDGHAWYAGTNFCINHGCELGSCENAILGSALWMDGNGNLHDSDRTIYATATVDENGIMTMSTTAEYYALVDGAEIISVKLTSDGMNYMVIVTDVTDPAFTTELCCVVLNIVPAI